MGAVRPTGNTGRWTRPVRPTMHTMNKTLSQWLFGPVQFQEREEYREFQYKLLIVLMVSGALLTAVLLLTVHMGVNPMDTAHVRAMTVFTTLATVLWWVLRGHKRRFATVAWLYELVCLLEYTSALVHVPQDELRIIWFYINVPGVYLLLGQRAGMIITGLTVMGLALGNAHLSAPYSVHAMATGLLSLVYLGLFFHVYADRLLSYFARMRESNDKLGELATRDALTGIYNARAYQDMCNRQLASARRRQSACAVLFVDLDHFKAINDQHGHLAGDKVLTDVAHCLTRQLRSTDVLGRVGGEEFSIFLPDTTLEGARQVADTIRLAVEALMPDTGNGKRLRVTASIGVTVRQADDETMESIQQRADQAMYAAKQQGRNRVSVLG